MAKNTTRKYQDSVTDEIQNVIRNVQSFKNYPIRELVRYEQLAISKK